MPLLEKTYYTYECDFDGCEHTAADDGEYTAWAQPEGAQATLESTDNFYEIDGKWFCPDHWHWCVDRDDDPMPGEDHEPGEASHDAGPGDDS